MAKVDPTTTDPWKQITVDIHELHDGFVEKQKLTLSPDRCERVRDYFKKSSEQAFQLHREVRISGAVGIVTLIGSAVATYFTKGRPLVHKFSTVLLIVGIVSIFWFLKRYIDRKNLQIDFFDKIPRSAQKKPVEIDQDLKDVADVISKGCDPKVSLAESSGQKCSLLAACMAKNSYHTAILIALMYKDKKRLKKDAEECFPYIREGRAPKAGSLLEQFGAHPDAKDTHLLRAAASKLNAVAVRELLGYGMAKVGLEYAVQASRAKRDITPILVAYGAEGCAARTKDPADLVAYLRSKGITLSEKHAKKILELLKA